MTKKLRMFRIKSRKQYWGVLAPDPAYKTFHNSLLQAQNQKVIVLEKEEQEKNHG